MFKVIPSLQIVSVHR